MYTIIHIVLLNIAMSLENAIVIGGIVHRARRLWAIVLTAAVLATLIRIVLVAGIHVVTRLPGLQLVLGLSVILIAYKMLVSVETRSLSTFLHIVLSVIVVDLALSLDNLISLAVVSEDLPKIAIGVFVSLVPLFFISPLVAHITRQFPLVQIVVATFVIQLGFQAVMNDQLVKKLYPVWSQYKLVPIVFAAIFMVYGVLRLYRTSKTSQLK